MKLLYVVNEARFFLSHRLPLALRARELGWEVVVATAPDTGEEALAQYGLRHVEVPMSRSDFKLFAELATYRAIRRLYQAERPDLVHHVTIKPVVYGSFAARSASVRAVVNAVPGMGFVFTRRGRLASIRRAFVNMLYRLALSHSNMRVIFQNSEDLRGFLLHAIVRKEQVVLIRGAGVDLERFKPWPEPDTPITFVLPSRMIRDKGVIEFSKAAAELIKRHPDWRFQLAGGVDPGNPASMTEDELKALETDYGVEWLGHRTDMDAVLRQAHIVCLPTRYREGVPKTLLEAAASGRAMIVSDMAGCREVVTEGVTGLLVDPRSVEEIADAMRRMGENDALRRRCAEAARTKAVAVFSEQDVVDHTFRVYQDLLAA